MALSHFLPYVRATRSPEVYEACKEMLEKHPQADPFAILHTVSTSTLDHQADVAVAKALAAKPILTTWRRRTKNK